MDIETIGLWLLFAVVLAVVFMVYASVVGKHLTVAGVAMNKDATVASTSGWFQWLDAKTQNWKTVMLAWVAGFSQLASYLTTDVISGWKDLPWAQVFDAKVANWITIVCAFLIPIVHSMGVAKAAVTPPVDPGA